MSAPVQPVVHTPGPWNLLCSEARGRPRCLVVCPRDNEIASINPFRESWNEDAELIAAAPDLLSALQMLLGLVETNEERQGFVSHQGNVARAAISKATGKRGSDE
jgi:hypothetical protein